MSKICPKCGNHIIRTKRTFKDKFLTFFFDSIVVLRRYHCQRCEWQGLRRKNSIQKHSPALNSTQPSYELVPIKGDVTY